MAPRGPRPGRRPRPVVPFDIPIEAFAVEVGGGAHPAVRSLGDRRLVYVEHRHALRRAYRRRQLLLAVGLAGTFVAVAGVALAPGGADASVPNPAPSGTRAATADVSTRVTPADRGPAPRRLPLRISPPGQPANRRPAAAASRPPDDRDEVPAPPPSVPGFQGRPLADAPFLVCTRQYESVHAGGYAALSPDGLYRGAYQFDRKTWDGVARHLERFDLVGVDPAAAEPAVQDVFAYTLYKWQGASHWHYRCDGLP